MRTLKLLTMAMTVALLVSVWIAMSHAADPPSSAASGAKSDTFAVVQIASATRGSSVPGGPMGGDDPESNIRVVSAAELEELRKTIIDEDKAALKAYQDTKKTASKDDPPLKPTKRKVVVLKGGFKTADDAEDWKIKHPPGVPGTPKSGTKKNKLAQ